MDIDRDVKSVGKFSPNRVLALVVALVLLAAIIATATNTRRDPLVLDRSTPQGVAQAYLTAIVSGKTEEAASYLSSKSDCKASDLDRVYLAQNSRIILGKTDLYGTTAQVRISVEISMDSPLQNSMYDDHTLRMSRVNGKWKLLGVPWPLYDCGAGIK